MAQPQFQPRNCSQLLECTMPRRVLRNQHGYDILECSRCGHRYTKPPVTNNHLQDFFSDEYFFGGKTGYPNYLLEKDLLYQSGLRYEKIASRFSKKGRMLGVGCAAGFILKAFNDKGWETEGVEPNAGMAQYGRNHLGLNIHVSGIEEFQTDHRFNLINMIQVVGSVYDLDAALKKVADLLAPDGIVIVENWDMDSRYAKMMKGNWHEYCPPLVINWFSDRTLVESFGLHHMKLIAQGRPKKKIKVLHAVTLFGESTGKFPLKKLLLKTIGTVFGKLTLPYPPFDLKWYVFRKVSGK